ncbi:hypothetical protein [Lysinibacillus sphaericus]|uniref:hypothetical protein n=1 Tax=Lysinibacillus sphaericus TaxID=1421 RepID=UPI00163CD6D5|nr:hypothetical protein [Lysinibacillus sp. SDF0037]
MGISVTDETTRVKRLIGRPQKACQQLMFICAKAQCNEASATNDFICAKAQQQQQQSA